MFINIDEFIEQTDEIKALEIVRALQTFLDSKVIFDEKVVKTLHSGMYTAEMDGVSGYRVMIKLLNDRRKIGSSAHSSGFLLFWSPYLPKEISP